MKLAFFNRVGSNIQCEQSVVGVGGSIVNSPSYVTGKFGNAINPGGGNGVIWPVIIPTGAFAIGMWWSPLYNSSSASLGYLVDAYNGVNDFIDIFTHADTPLILLYRQAGLQKVRYDYIITYTAGIFYHVLVTFDDSLGNGQRFRLWIDGVSQTPSVIVTDLSFTISSPMDYVPEHRTYAFPAGAIDNIKIWPPSALGDIDSINKGRRQERYGMNDSLIIM